MDREQDIIDGIRRGLADVEAGRVVPHDQAMAEIDALLDEAERRHKERAAGRSKPAMTVSPHTARMRR